jgi:hypothetical protein
VNGENQRKLVQGINCLSWLDFSQDEYVYYSSDYYGMKLWRVNTTGTPKPELLASNLGGPDGSTSDGACYWTISADGTRIAGFIAGAVRAGTIGGGTIVWKTLRGGCGGSVSPDGTVATRNSGSHDGIFFHSFDTGDFLDKYFNPHDLPKEEAAKIPALTVNDCPNCGTNWHRMHWAVNSNNWLIITQGMGYNTDKGSCATLLKTDGSKCIQIGPLIYDEDWKNAEHYQGSSFWFGNPDGSVFAKKNLDVSESNTLQIRRSGHRFSINLTEQQTVDFNTLRIFSVNGALLYTVDIYRGKSLPLDLPGNHSVAFWQLSGPTSKICKRIMCAH